MPPQQQQQQPPINHRRIPESVPFFSEDCELKKAPTDDTGNTNTSLTYSRDRLCKPPSHTRAMQIPQRETKYPSLFRGKTLLLIQGGTQLKSAPKKQKTKTGNKSGFGFCHRSLNNHGVPPGYSRFTRLFLLSQEETTVIEFAQRFGRFSALVFASTAKRAKVETLLYFRKTSRPDISENTEFGFGNLARSGKIER